MKKLCLILLMFLSLFLIMPFNTTYAKGTQEPVPDTVADSHSKYSAYYQVTSTRFCSAILISSTAALTAKHCVGAQPAKRSGRIYPGLNGNERPFGYMNISTYIPYPNPKYDIAIIKGTERDQDRFYKYYIKKFKTTVTGYTDEEFKKFKDEEVYSYGYPDRRPAPLKVQYRSDGIIMAYKTKTLPTPYLFTDMPNYEGQSGSGVFKKDGQFLGIITTRSVKYTANVLPFTTEIADWINKNAN
ncbi:serine protease [Staphylococcus delphini]|uniref:Serine protease n=1 Tax=Staphylococcus delphini TaxID=53344 RepID=A0A2A4GVN7_9STAP|nr:trypsin-like peptidase domain-containing protein [Staphylococcus delphini]PCF54325.1 serine protease [Staphylococcus delphini]PCF61188.1 serine protease [Staphylococcus delphini]HEC2158439.1 trypsin-like peptidase domain-containing protein [Staphylococcus delphini]